MAFFQEVFYLPVELELCEFKTTFWKLTPVLVKEMSMETVWVALLQFFLSPFRDRFVTWNEKKRAKQATICQEAWERIKKERSNFSRILAGKEYNSEAHRKAVEETSFELLRVSIEKLQTVRKFRKSGSLLLGHIESKDAAGVLIEIDKLEPRLARFIDS